MISMTNINLEVAKTGSYVFIYTKEHKFQEKKG